ERSLRPAVHPTGAAACADATPVAVSAHPSLQTWGDTVFAGLQRLCQSSTMRTPASPKPGTQPHRRPRAMPAPRGPVVGVVAPTSGASMKRTQSTLAALAALATAFMAASPAQAAPLANGVEVTHAEQATLKSLRGSMPKPDEFSKSGREHGAKPLPWI